MNLKRIFPVFLAAALLGPALIYFSMTSVIAHADDSAKSGGGEKEQKKLTPAELRSQLNKLRLLEEKNVSRLKEYENNPTASIKLKSNLVIIRLKIQNISKQLGIDPNQENEKGK
ncbi:MAG: hypothetical protein EBR09_08990 [Proteobacteria bacterium]|nr:hypothetical protein [Pseudomonadota bacterium]